MSDSTQNTSLQLARLQHRKGALHEARLLSEEAMVEASARGQSQDWIESARLYFQCCHELEELSEAQSVIDQTINLSRNTSDERLQGMAENLIGSWLLANGKLQESQDYINSAIEKATQSGDLDTLVRALFTNAMSRAFEPAQFAQSLLQLNKLDTILAEMDNAEMQLTSRLLRTHIFTQTGKLEAANDLLWDCYEQAKLHGFHLLISRILAQMAFVNRELGNKEAYRIYAELALRGTDKTRLPRVYKFIRQMCPEDIVRNAPQFDFQIDEAARSVQERTKGLIDFRNQHILFDLALLFIKKAGTRYSKEDLIEIIWQQAYDPELHDNLIYVSIKRLRALLEPDMESPRYILRDRKGYYFNPQSSVHFRQSEEATL
ncbi:winged helix-turn-helix domain-containing protein [Bdellovibrio bacteriovorus]|uniref:Response regulator n=1 Tax=Bdellovibrio bacteriovorus TaxID=959 RepID=A0A1Z3N951_BDEBC|nr:helix-turn-helix domain-containing protein [Bdellovibrio bacteriovorus]ASD64003.1 response regulator [Bdellovibrio bacteriovorus]